MCPRVLVFLLVASTQIYAEAETDSNDFTVLSSLTNVWSNTPPNWVGADPCGSKWEGISCSNSRVSSIELAAVGLTGQLSGDIFSLSELEFLDLSYNVGLNGPLPTSIVNLKKLRNLKLVGCSFSGPIPQSIGSLQLLKYLDLNSNRFTGPIPHTIGNLSNLYVLDLSRNRLDGPIPVSSGTTSGLDMLVNTKHFHLQRNRFSGTIPHQLFRSDMTLIHVLLHDNHLTGSIPSTLGLVQTLEAVCFDGNSLTGPVPSNLNNLTRVSKLVLSNNKFTGLVPNLFGMAVLSYLDMSNNSFDASDFPVLFSNLPSLTTLMMENTQLQGQIPSTFFDLPNLQTLILRNNQLNGTLDIATSSGSQLQFIDMQNNHVSEYSERPTGRNKVDVILMGNPVCENTTKVTENYCTVPQPNSSLYARPPRKCVPLHCISDQISSPNCKCAYPYRGVLVFRPPFLESRNSTKYVSLQEEALMDSFKRNHLPVDSVSVNGSTMDSLGYLESNLSVFPSGQNHFNTTWISEIGFVLSLQSIENPNIFGPSYFKGAAYPYVDGKPTAPKNLSSTGIIIGTAAGCSFLLLLLLAGAYAYRQKKRAERASEQNNHFADWNLKKCGNIPQLKGVRCFTFNEIMKYTNNFSEANQIGSGGYGIVYRGMLPTGQLIAIKRSQHGSMQGEIEFKTEIEVLSRVHHKNVVDLVGFCFEQGEQMLIYEFVVNGSLKDSLSGTTGVRLDWMRRLKVALGAARGLAYLHELVNPPIIHRDVKSANILLDECLNAKVADFGLSKPIGDSEEIHVTSQVKGTMGYIDPEYQKTLLLTEKSDVYGFGVVMLELVTGRKPLARGKYLLTEVRSTLERKKDLYNLHELLDPNIGVDMKLKGLDKIVDLAMECLQDSGADRPVMGEVVKEIENILQLAGLNPNAESTSTSASFDEASHEEFPLSLKEEEL